MHARKDVGNDKRFSGVARKVLQLPTVLTVFIASKRFGVRVKGRVAQIRGRGEWS
jgi:hypothetical protein